MATYIGLQKSSETSKDATYTLELTDGRTGQIRIDKVLGEVSLLEAIPGDELEGYNNVPPTS